MRRRYRLQKLLEVGGVRLPQMLVVGQRSAHNEVPDVGRVRDASLTGGLTGGSPSPANAFSRNLILVRFTRRMTGPTSGSSARASSALEERRRVYARMLEEARVHLSEARPVVLDATYARKADRLQAHALATELGVPFFAVEVVASDEIVRNRLAARAQQARSASDADWNVYVAQQRSFDPLDEIAPRARVRIDGSAPLTSSINLILQRIRPAT
jgi:predicted kinase